MNYNGDRSLKAGSDEVQGNSYDKLIESDQAGPGKPWLNLMTEEQDDTQERPYFTFWEYTSRKFMD